MLNIVCALPVEARPLIDYYGMKSVTKGGLRYFKADNVRLIVSGSGKVNSAAAVAQLFGLTGYTRQAAWLNLGIAGHRRIALGELCLVDELREQSNSRTQYPYFPINTKLSRASCVCVDLPCADYNVEGLVDMESWGFYQIACRYSSSELVQIAKIVSDNQQHPLPEKFDLAAISDLVEAQLPAIDQLLQQLSTLQAQLIPVDFNLSPLLNVMRFSQSQQLQLQEVVRQWVVLQGDVSVDEFLVGDFVDAKDCLCQLRARLEQVMQEYNYD